MSASTLSYVIAGYYTSCRRKRRSDLPEEGGWTVWRRWGSEIQFSHWGPEAIYRGNPDVIALREWVHSPEAGRIVLQDLYCKT